MLHSLRPARFLVVVCAAVAFAGIGCGESESVQDLPPLKRDGTPLEAGSYRTTKFVPETKFEVGGGWATASPEGRDYFDLVRGDSFKAISVQRVERVIVPTNPVTGNSVEGPPDLVAWIRTHPRLAVGRPSEAEVGGQEGTQIDATVKSAPKGKAPEFCDRPCLPLFVPSDGREVTYEPGDKLRFLVLPNGVTITVAAAADEFAAFAEEAEDVLSSIEFG